MRWIEGVGRNVLDEREKFVCLFVCCVSTEVLNTGLIRFYYKAENT